MQVYQQRPEEDVLFLQWWEVLVTSGELASTLGEPARTLGRFYALLRPPQIVLYEVDDHGLWLVFVLSPILDGSALALWIAPRKRHAAREALPALELAYETAFGEAPIVIGLTRQRRLLAAHLRWGYQLVGEIPGLWGGETTWVLYLTEAAYRAAKDARRRRGSRGNHGIGERQFRGQGGAAGRDTAAHEPRD